MRRHASSPIFALLLVWSMPFSLLGQGQVQVDELLLPGTVNVEVLRAVAHPEYARVASKVQAAVQANEAWFREYVANNDPGPGQALPYHPNLGITEAEYRYFLTLADSASVTVAARAELTIDEVPDGILFSVPDLPALDGIRVDFTTGTLQTPASMLATVGEVHVERSAVGAWDGWQWSRSEGNPLTGDAVEESVSIGRLRHSGDTLISYRYRQVVNGQFTGRSDLMVRFAVR